MAATPVLLQGTPLVEEGLPLEKKVLEKDEEEKEKGLLTLGPSLHFNTKERRKNPYPLKKVKLTSG